MTNNTEVGILKSLWGKNTEGKWSVEALKGLMLKPREGFESDFFPVEGPMTTLTDRNPFVNGVEGWLATFGTVDFLVKQSILPVVAWAEGDSFIRCIGTAFVVSATGYIITAYHVILDPYEGKYAKTEKSENRIKLLDGMRFGVLIPVNPASGQSGSLFFPFKNCRYWGEWKNSPLLHEDPRFDMLTDIAICKISLFPNGAGHQPLALSLKNFKPGERAFAFGYSEMENILIEYRDGHPTVPEFNQELYVAVGPVKNLFPNNHQTRQVMVPGPCFDFSAKVPGKMSGGPIFGADGGVVRGVVSRSFSGEKHAYGAMTAPAMDLPLENNTTLQKLMDSGNEGIARVNI